MRSKDAQCNTVERPCRYIDRASADTSAANALSTQDPFEMQFREIYSPETRKIQNPRN